MNWEEKKIQPNLETWLSELEGSLICACDHGCNGWTLDNGAKALLVIRALAAGASVPEADAIVQRHTKDVNRQVWNEVHTRMRATEMLDDGEE